MSMTIQQAIRALRFPGDHLKSYDEYGLGVDDELKEAMSMAITVLREKAEREDPKPLSLDELRKLNAGEVIWHQSLQGLSSSFVVLRHHDIEIFKSELTAARYGKTWIVFRHKPKEVTE